MSRFDDAIVFATQVYAGKLRKGSINPFIIHALETAAIASGISTDEDVLIAALLHDAVEDAGCDPDVIYDKFGRRVTSLVMADTEPDVPAGAKDVWMAKKVAMIDYLKKSASRDAKVVILADRLSNLRSIYNDYRVMGAEAWSIFHEQTEPSVQAWYYNEVLEQMDELSGTTAYEEYTELVKKAFGDI